MTIDLAPSDLAQTAPSGVGVFTRALRESIVGTPEQLAQRCKALGIAFVPLMAGWQDPRSLSTPNDGALERYAEALAMSGIDTWLWGYPWAGGEHEFVDAMFSRARSIAARGVILDPEVSYKHKPDAMVELVSRTLAAKDDTLSVGFTSFGLPAFHPTFPWKEAQAIGWGCPQDYDTTVHQTLASLDQWEALGWKTLVPALPAYGPASEPGALDRVVDAVVARPSVRGLVFWSWNQLDGHDDASIMRAARALAPSPRSGPRPG